MDLISVNFIRIWKKVNNMIKSEKVSGGLIVSANGSRDELVVDFGMIVRCLIKDNSLTLAEIISSIIVAFEKEAKLETFYKIVEETKGFKIK